MTRLGRLRPRADFRRYGVVPQNHVFVEASPMAQRIRKMGPNSDGGTGYLCWAGSQGRPRARQEGREKREVEKTMGNLQGSKKVFKGLWIACNERMSSALKLRTMRSTWGLGKGDSTQARR